MITKYFVYIVIIQSVFANILAASGTKGQNYMPLKQMAFSVSEYKTVSQVFSLIEERTDLIFSIDENKLEGKLDTKLFFDQSETNLEQVLLRISRERNIGFKRINNNVIVFSRKRNSEPGNSVIEYLSDVEISGKITDENGQGLPGASVIEKGTTNGTTTDLDGQYKLTLPENAILVVSFVGYVTREISIAGRDMIDVRMEQDAEQLEEVVVIGYGTSSKSKVTGSVVSLDAESIDDVPFSDVSQAIAGKLAGVQVTQNGGAPGSSPGIVVRGIATLTAGTSPLIVLDGLPLSEDVNIQSINPGDIQSIDVLKDAASAAIYGSRGSNGVILITTKKGTTGAPQFSFNSSFGVQRVARKLDLVNAYEFAEMIKEARDSKYIALDPLNHSVDDTNDIRRLNSSSKGVLIPNYILPYLDRQIGLTDTDWQDAIFRDAPIRNHEISARGGNGTTNYFVSGSYFDQEGIVVNSDFKRYSLRLNLETRFNDKLRYGINLAPSFSVQNKTVEGWEDSPVAMGINSHPFFPVFNTDGSYAISDQINIGDPYGTAPVENVVAIAEETLNEREDTRILGGTYLELDIIDGLTAKAYLGGYVLSSRSNYFRPSWLGIYKAAAPTVSKRRSSTFRITNWISENTLTYSKTLNGKHNFEVLAGYSIQKENIENNFIEGQNLALDEVPVINQSNVFSASNDEEEWVLISYLGRLRYDFDNKILFSAAIRRDGSSRFGDGSPWGLFPSVSAGWRVSEEAFFPDKVVLSNLKLRGSFGITGNNQIDNYGGLALLSSSNYNFNGAVADGIRPSTSPNSDLSWEESETIDFGIELGFIDNKLNVDIDYYSTITKGLLLEVPVPGYSGFEESLQNIGKVKNSGFETVISYTGSLGPIQLNSSLNFSTNKNEVLELGPDQDQIISDRNITKIGESIGEHYGYNIVGIFETQDQLDNLPNYRNSQQIGEYIYADLNEDGIINSDDRTTLGSFWPDYTWGLNTSLSFKGFDLSFSLYGVQGVNVNDRLVSVGLVGNEVWSTPSREYYENAWRSTDDPGIYAKPGIVTNTLYRESDLHNDDASYIRIRNITVGYNLSPEILDKTFLSSARIYVTAKNPAMFTHFRGYNPEQSGRNPLQPGITTGNYPQEKSFVVGLNLNF